MMNEKLVKISNQLEELNYSFQHLQLETKFNNFYKTLVALKSTISQFQNTIQSYKFNETILYSEVNKFVDNYKNQNFEAKIIAFLEVKIATSKAPIDLFIDVIKKKSASKFFELKSSTNKLIFELVSNI